jgi:hypothetical protein
MIHISVFGAEDVDVTQQNAVSKVYNAVLLYSQLVHMFWLDVPMVLLQPGFSQVGCL